MDREIITNKKAYFDYEVLEEFTAGIMLTGPEIKSIRAGSVSLKGAYVTLTANSAWLKKTNISRYKHDSREIYDPFRDRKLLLKKRELHKLEDNLNTKGLTVVPLSIFLQNDRAKVKIGVVRGRKHFDKRNLIKERTVKREIERQMKRY